MKKGLSAALVFLLVVLTFSVFTLQVLANEPPVANDDAYITDEDTVLIVSAPGVLGNDADIDADLLTASVVSGPTDGSVTFKPDGSFTYTPSMDFNGLDVFTYRAYDGEYHSNIATVTIEVTSVNDAPVAGDYTYIINEDDTLTVLAPGVLGNDADPDGDLLTAVLISGPGDGTLTFNSDGSFTYVPSPNFHGPDTFNYEAQDPYGLVDDATVTITVVPVNDSPMANDDYATTYEDSLPTELIIDVLANDSDVDGNQLTAVLVEDAVNGMVAPYDDSFFTYTPDPDWNGVDSFTYKASDGSLDSNVATVTITVVPVNDPPLITSTPPTAATVGALYTYDVEAVDPDLDVLTYSLTTAPAGMTINSATGLIQWTPTIAQVGENDVEVEVSDGMGGLATQRFTVTVTEAQGVPEFPLALPLLMSLAAALYLALKKRIGKS